MSSLLKSRKFWLTIATIVAAAVMLATKQITAPQFTAAFVAVVSVLVGGIAHEDNGGKSVGSPTVNVLPGIEMTSTTPEETAKQIASHLEKAMARPEVKA